MKTATAQNVVLIQSDLKITSIRQGRHYTIRVTHLPTGTTIEVGGEGYLMQREQALKLLEEKLNAD